MAINGNLPLWLERVLLPGAWDITVGEGQTVSAHWAQHYYQHGYGATVAEAMDLFHEDLMRTPGFETDYRSTIGPVALAAALPHPYSHELIFPHLKANQMVTRQTSDLEFGYGVSPYGIGLIYDPAWETTLRDEELSDYVPGKVLKGTGGQYSYTLRDRDISDLEFGYGQDPVTRGSTGYTYDPEFSAITGDHPAADIYIPDYAIPTTTTYTLTREQQGLLPLKEKAMPSNGVTSITALDFGYGAGAFSIPSMAPAYSAPRRRAAKRVSVGANIPRAKTAATLNKFMHEWRKQIRQLEGRLGGFYGPARPSRRTSGRRRSVGRHRHKINSFSYQRQGRRIHSHRVKSRRR
jgi:hypothetical protein